MVISIEIGNEYSMTALRKDVISEGEMNREKERELNINDEWSFQTYRQK